MVRTGLTAFLAAAFAFSAAQAAPISVANGTFENPYTLTTVAPRATSAQGAAGWNVTGSAGTLDPTGGAGNYVGSEDFRPGRVGWVNAGATLSQDLGVTIASDIVYQLTADFGNRIGHTFSGQFGFYAGNPSNIIGTASITNPGAGLWTLQSLALDASFFSAFVGQTLGIIFIGSGVQFNVDNVLVEFFRKEDVLTNPIPGAAWLFGTAIAGAAAASRRKKKAA